MKVWIPDHRPGHTPCDQLDTRTAIPAPRTKPIPTPKPSSLIDKFQLWPGLSSAAGITAPAITKFQPRVDNIIPPETLCELPRVEEVSSSEDFSDILGEILDSMPGPSPTPLAAPDYSADLIKPPAPLLAPFLKKPVVTPPTTISASFFT